MEMELDEKEEEIYKNYIIEFREINGPTIIVILNNYFVFYLLIKTNIFNLKLYLTFRLLKTDSAPVHGDGYKPEF
jgi:hypothetical protein